MSVTFPGAPAPNERVISSTGAVWEWDGSKWTHGPGGISAADVDSLVAMRFPVSIANGGTGGTTAYQARLNLGVENRVPITGCYLGAVPANGLLLIPLAVPLSLAPNFDGCVCYAFLPQAAQFWIYRVWFVAGVRNIEAIGSFSFAGPGNNNAFGWFNGSPAGVALAAGEALLVVAPATAIPGLDTVGVTFMTHPAT